MCHFTFYLGIFGLSVYFGIFNPNSSELCLLSKKNDSNHKFERLNCNFSRNIIKIVDILPYCETCLCVFLSAEKVVKWETFAKAVLVNDLRVVHLRSNHLKQILNNRSEQYLGLCYWNLQLVCLPDSISNHQQETWNVVSYKQTMSYYERIINASILITKITSNIVGLSCTLITRSSN